MQSEAALLAKAKAGDEAALERMMLGVYPRLRSVIEPRIPARLKPLLNVDDVLQEAFVTVFQQISRFESRGQDAFFAWVARIAETRLLDAIKSESAIKRGGQHQRVGPQPLVPEGPGSWLELLAAHERTPSRDAGALEAVELIRSALGRLTADQQSALRLRYIEGLSVADTARKLQRSEGAVCLLCHRGMLELRSALGSSGRFFLSGP